MGNYDFNSTPLAPPGTKCIIHLKPQKRGTFQTHGIDAWYIGPSMQHYRCFKCFVPETGGTRDADTVEFFPQQIPFPNTTPETYLQQTAADMLSILSEPKSNIPSLKYGNKYTNAFIDIAKMLKNITPPSFPKNNLPKENDTPTSHTNEKLPEPNYSPTSPPHAATQPRVKVSNSTPGTKSIQFPRNQNSHQTQLPRVQKMQPHTKPNKQPKSRINRMYTKRTPQRHGFQKHHNYHTRSRQNGLLAQSVIGLDTYDKHYANHVFHHETGAKQSIDRLLQDKDAKTWTTALSNEFGRLAQGVGKRRPQDQYVQGTNTIFFIKRDNVPRDAKVTYANLICDLRPLKAETHRVRMTVGGDKLSYEGDPSSPAVSLLNTQKILNSVISDAHNQARFSSADVKNHYL